MKIEEIEKRIDNNAKKIIENSNRIEKNLEKIKTNSNSIEVLHTIKTYNNRFFYMWVLTFVALISSFVLNVILLKRIIEISIDTNTIETITTQEVEQETDEGSNYFVGGDMNGKAED